MNEVGFNSLLNRVLSRMKDSGASEEKIMKATQRIQARKSLLLSKKVELKKGSKQPLSKLSIPNPEDIEYTSQVREAVCGLSNWNKVLEIFKKSLPIYSGEGMRLR